MTFVGFVQFSAQLRLPESMSTHVKHELVQELIQQLDMEKCTHTSMLVCRLSMVFLFIIVTDSFCVLCLLVVCRRKQLS